jgi:hypothetical protein
VTKAQVGLRAAFAVGFFGLELAVIAWGQRAPDHVFGFQMFNESSRITIHLKREVRRQEAVTLVPVPRGTWRAPNRDGAMVKYNWQSRVRYFPLTALEQDVHASYGLRAQLFRLQAALEDMASHIPEDTTTLALVADVETLHNGLPGPTVRLRAQRP